LIYADINPMARIQLSFRFEKPLLDALSIAAELESRDRSSLMETVLSEWLNKKYPALWEEAFPDLAAKRRQYMIDYKLE
jgi:hypothetical protein